MFRMDFIKDSFLMIQINAYILHTTIQMYFYNTNHTSVHLETDEYCQSSRSYTVCQDVFIHCVHLNWTSLPNTFSFYYLVLLYLIKSNPSNSQAPQRKRSFYFTLSGLFTSSCLLSSHDADVVCVPLLEPRPWRMYCRSTADDLLLSMSLQLSSGS